MKPPTAYLCQSAMQIRIFPRSNLYCPQRATGEFELRAIKVLARRHFGANAVVRLFGSRTDDTLIGGDVGLHIEAESDELASLANELAFRVDLTEVIQDEKVDVIVRAPSYEPRAINRIAQHTGLRLA